jgi:hypothetical protein
VKTRGRPFQKGNTGRPKGSRNHATAILAALTDADATAIQRAVIEKAKKGDMVAARIILDRISPAPRGRPISFPLPKAQDAPGVLAAHAAMIDAVAKGTITIDEGTAISQLLSAQLKAIESTETDARLRAIEQQLALQPQRHERPRSW